MAKLFTQKSPWKILIGLAPNLQELKPAGIGFIRPHSGKVDDKDLFFHKSALKNSSLVDDVDGL